MSGLAIAVTPGPIFRWAVQALFDAQRGLRDFVARVKEARHQLDFRLWLLTTELDTGWWCRTQRPKTRYRRGGKLYVARFRGWGKPWEWWEVAS